MGVDTRVLRELLPYDLQLGFLLIARDGYMAALPGGDALLQRGIVEIAATPKHFVQHPHLCGSRTQFLFVRLAHHLHVLYRPVCASTRASRCVTPYVAPAQHTATCAG